MTNTGCPSSMSAIGPCLSSPAAKPSAWMYASSLSLSAPSIATGYPTCRPRNSTEVVSTIDRAVSRTRSARSMTCWILSGMARSSARMVATSSENLLPRSCARYRPTRYAAVICARNALVDATAISGPACV